MSLAVEPEVREWTLADLYERFGPMLLSRLRRAPEPGTATEDDVEAIHAHEKRLCELVDGILVEKTTGLFESNLAIRIASLLVDFIRPRKLGQVFGESGMMILQPGLIRIPDVSFVSKARLKTITFRPGSRLEPLVPDLAVEVLSAGNTKKEMDDKLRDYFDAGVQLVWYVDPRVPQVTVYRDADRSDVLKPPAVLTGDPVLPGLTISLTELFAPPEED
jgi:Uma2 family endonuclease